MYRFQSRDRHYIEEESCIPVHVVAGYLVLSSDRSLFLVTCCNAVVPMQVVLIVYASRRYTLVGIPLLVMESVVIIRIFQY